uniref:K Homology domain-containing protein n=1 Tax=Physcomitrium patens TaxID=3218 RepID=A0A7I4APY2_PHYPA
MDRGYNGKRPHPLYDGDFPDRNGRQKRRNEGSYSSRELGGGQFVSRDLPLPMVAANLADDVVFRILCPAPKIGSVIGKGGSIIKTLRQESGAKIKIADAIPGVDERVILISSTDRGNDRGRGKDGSGRESRSGVRGRDGRSRERDGGKEGDKKDTERDSAQRDSEELTPAQEALFKVHARIIADVETSGIDGSDQEEEPSQQVVTRLLVPNNQIGCLLGKGGKIIEQMRQTTGAQIRVLPKDQLPGCALPTDELVQVSGDVSTLKKALLFISARLQENPPRDRPQSYAAPAPAFVPVTDYLAKDSYRSKGTGHVFGLGPEPLEGRSWTISSGNLSLDRQDNRRSKEGRDSGENELVFRLLCPSDKIGSVIGKGGSIIHNLRKDTGARIKIANAVPGSDERVIIVSALELPGDSFSPALEAMIQVQSRITAEMGGDKDGIITTRLLVPTNQIGCLLGKGGSIIEDMRRATRANIRVLPKDTLPRCALDTDELVQIVGDTTVAREALFQVISRLRNNAFRESGSETGRGGGGGRDFGHSMPPLSMSRESYSSSYDFGSRMESRSTRGGVFSLPGMSISGAIHSSSGFGSLASPPEAWGIGRREQSYRQSRDKPRYDVHHRSSYS